MYKQYRRETPQGVITKAEFMDVMKQMGIADSFLQDLLFSAFANKRTGAIRFEDMTRALSIITRGSTEEKLECMFLQTIVYIVLLTNVFRLLLLFFFFFLQLRFIYSM
jgi:Ca2+-binding EF-hand superfamily protein